MKRFLLLALLALLALRTSAPAESPYRWTSPVPELVAAAEADDPRALALLGARIRLGDGVPRDYEEAAALLGRAAGSGDPIGMVHLAALLERGLALPRDSPLAAEWTARALPGLREEAAGGNAEAALELGELYAWGRGVPEDQAEANRFYRAAAEGGDPRGQYLLGYRLFHGIGEEPDREAGVLLLERAATAGNGAAACMLGDLHAAGNGVPLDRKKAEAFYRIAQSGPAPREETGPEGYRFAGLGVPGDRAVPGHAPPPCRMEIEEGSCGEACLWSVLRARGIEATQLAINRAGGAPGRGLHAYELDDALAVFGVDCETSLPRMISLGPAYLKNGVRKVLRRPPPEADRWEEDLEEVLGELRAGRPVLVGVKIVPDRFPQWPVDHFLLFVGVNDRTGEILYNDFHRRKRMPAASLLGTEEGYTFVNRYGLFFRILFP